MFENFRIESFIYSINFFRSNKEHIISVIIKCGNEDGGTKQDIANKLHLFEKEAEMFNKTLPAMYDILGE